MLAFLFGFFIFLFVGVGIFKLFGAKSVGKTILKTILMIVGEFVFTVLILLIAWKFLNVDIIRGAIVLFFIVAILVIIGVVVKFFGGKSVAKFTLFSVGTIAFIVIALGLLVFVGQAIMEF